MELFISKKIIMGNISEQRGCLSVEKNNWKAYIWPSISLSLQAATTVMFVASLYLLVSNLSRGFDITDESLYILLADQPENMLVSVTQFGYYTSFLYQLSGEDIATFRLLGLLVLLITGLIFTISLERYWSRLSGTDTLTSPRLSAIVPLASGALAYYHSWLMTPSYNWLAFVGMFLVATGLLRAVTEKDVRNSDVSDVKQLIVSSLFIGLGGGLAFMAKPTTAAMLGVLSLLWVYAHPEYRRKNHLLILSVSISIIFFVFHAVVYRGGFVVFINELMRAVSLSGLLGAGHSISNLSDQVVIDMTYLADQIMQYESFRFLLAAYIMVLIFNWLKFRHKIISGAYVLLVAVGLLLWVQLLDTNFSVFMKEGYAVLVISVYFLLSAFVVNSQKIIDREKENRPPFWRLLILFFFLFILQSAYAFGSANGFLHMLSGANVFLCAASLYTVYWIEHNKKYKLFSDAVALLITVSIFVVLNSGYDNPYWLKTSIEDQTVPRTLMLNDSELYVDVHTADYITQLKKVAIEAGWVPDTALIDLTGAAPGAGVILGSKFLAAPYLISGYKGSDLFAQETLAQVPLSELKQAWVLTSSGGVRQLSPEVLVKNGVNFPGDYKMVGKNIAEFLYYGRSNEHHILWRPNPD